MSREILQSLDGERMRFRATVERFGTKHAYRGWPPETVLLTDVRRADTGEQVTGHLWFTCGQRWSDVYAGVTVEFMARVGTYEKGYQGYREDVEQWSETDWRLEYPTGVKIIDRPADIDAAVALGLRQTHYHEMRCL